MGARKSSEGECLNVKLIATRSFNRATLKIIGSFRTFKASNPIITNKAYVSIRIDNAALAPVVVSNDKIGVAVTLYTRNRRNVDGLHRCSCTYLRFSRSRNPLEGGITG